MSETQQVGCQFKIGKIEIAKVRAMLVKMCITLDAVEAAEDEYDNHIRNRMATFGEYSDTVSANNVRRRHEQLVFDFNMDAFEIQLEKQIKP
jgi:hypothetical protein